MADNFPIAPPPGRKEAEGGLLQRFELLLEFYRSVLPALISRISEREESVRLEIFATLSILLHQTLVFGRASRSNEDDGFSRLSPATLKRKREEEENEDARMEEPFDES